MANFKPSNFKYLFNPEELKEKFALMYVQEVNENPLDFISIIYLQKFMVATREYNEGFYLVSIKKGIQISVMQLQSIMIMSDDVQISHHNPYVREDKKRFSYRNTFSDFRKLLEENQEERLDIVSTYLHYASKYILSLLRVTLKHDWSIFAKLEDISVLFYKEGGENNPVHGEYACLYVDTEKKLRITFEDSKMFSNSSDYIITSQVLYVSSNNKSDYPNEIKIFVDLSCFMNRVRLLERFTTQFEMIGEFSTLDNGSKSPNVVNGFFAFTNTQHGNILDFFYTKPIT
jgi:hypothetical protein